MHHFITNCFLQRHTLLNPDKLNPRLRCQSSKNVYLFLFYKRCNFLGNKIDFCLKPFSISLIRFISAISKNTESGFQIDADSYHISHMALSINEALRLSTNQKAFSKHQFENQPYLDHI